MELLLARLIELERTVRIIVWADRSEVSIRSLDGQILYCRKGADTLPRALCLAALTACSSISDDLTPDDILDPVE